MADAKTVTILFTDLVGSTELLQRAGDEHAQRIFKAHHRLLREAVEAHGGHEVKWLGDGLMVAFDSASEAVKCAIAMQQASRRPAAGERLEIRAGLNVGEAFLDEADYFGSSVVIARRLCDRGGAGQILASDIVARLVQGRSADISTKDLGALDLKGIAEPVPAVEIIYHHDPMELLRKPPFVGRKSELETLLKKLGESNGGHGSIVLVAGEPGIGKSRLMDEFCEHAQSSGARILRGSCYEGDISAPFRPWVEALRSYVQATDDTTLREQMAAGAPEITTLLPELGQRFPNVQPAPRLEADAERLRFFDSIAQLVRNAASSPLVIFIDDLQWADRPSLLLLLHIARSVGSERIILAGTYRDVEVDRTHALSEALGSLRRLENFQRIALHGLPEETVDQLLVAIEPSDQAVLERQTLAAALFRETEGNPLFLREVLSHLVETSRLQPSDTFWASGIASMQTRGIPEGVRDVIGRRLARLSDGCNKMLARASLMTGGFSWNELTAICGDPEDALLDYLDEALRSQLIVEREQPARETYDFAHAMVRHTLYEELSGPRRVLLHRQIAEALEHLHERDLDGHAAELAHHYVAAAGGDAQKAVEYSVRAGDQAMRQYGWEEASVHYQRGLHATEMTMSPDTSRQSDLLIRLGQCQERAGRGEAAIEAFRRAFEVGREAGRSDLMARAAISFEDASFALVEQASLRAEAAALLDEAIAGLDDKGASLRVQAQVARIRPAAALAHSGGDVFSSGGFGAFTGSKQPELIEQAKRAVEAAEALKEPSVAALALLTLHNYDHTASNARERLAIADELIRVGRLAMDANFEALGRGWRLVDLFELGDVAACRDELDSYATFVHETRQHYHIALATQGRGNLAMAEGRFTDAERFVFEGLGLGQQVGAQEVTTAFGGQLFTLRWLQGRLSEVEGVIRLAVAGSPTIVAFRAALSLIHSHMGHRDEAAQELKSIALDSICGMPSDFLWSATIVLLAEVCSELSNEEYAEMLYELLDPYQDLNATILHAAAFGSNARSLGTLASVLSRWDDAERHYESAVATNAAMGFRPWSALSQLNYSDMLLRRNRPGDRERGIALLNEALTGAREMGMGKVAGDAEALLAGLS
jgi:class 3 adenylate cyclase/tetratricopeptide (TPR) repeat protein